MNKNNLDLVIILYIILSLIAVLSLVRFTKIKINKIVNILFGILIFLLGLKEENIILSLIILIIGVSIVVYELASLKKQFDSSISNPASW